MSAREALRRRGPGPWGRRQQASVPSSSLVVDGTALTSATTSHVDGATVDGGAERAAVV